VSVSGTQTYAVPAVHPTANGIPPTPLPRVGPARRRSPVLVSLGVVLVVVGALGAWRYVASASTSTHSYLAVYQPVEVGDQITADDLQTVTISTSRGLTPILATQESRVIGEYAAVALVPGTLLTDQQLSSTNAIGPNQALVGLQLSPAQRPGRTLKPGDHLLLIQVPSSSTSSQSDTSTTGTAPTLPTMPAKVVGIGDADNDNNVVVDVAVPQSSSSLLAYFADQNKIAAVLVAGG
jgi:hypothetical protein